ncbi:BCCT family transporter [Burkholderia alba]|uniref:BCCT family transporter n=1 Tax=Burkholderia alba TaxID=2683677 RepID=UPI002B0527E0|nr:BCCT family transporter [Burkholderia alba]
MSQDRPTPRTTFKPAVVVPSLLVIGALLVVCALRPDEAGALFGAGQQWIISRFDWFYVLAVTTFLVFLVLIAGSKYGNIKLGPDDAEPEFSFVSWTAMLFAAGMGIGLMYFGVGEPMQHYLKPPTVAGGTPEAAREAMLMTFFHWGFHAWAVYGVMGLVLAYFGFRYNLPLTLRSGLYPVLRERVNGWIGHAVDAFALVGTVAGIAATLGYGVLQISAGLHTVAGWDTAGNTFRIGLIALVVLLAGLSAASGLDKGVRRLSELNLLIAFLLLAFVVVTGPTSFLLAAFSDNVGQYLSNLVELSFRTYSYAPPREAGWFGGWTILYWAWWVSWSPFVGMFIARISRGRTIRQFVIGVLLVPTAFNLVWMTVFGNSAIWLDTHVAGGALAQTATQVDALLFRFFDYLPLSQLLSIVAILLIAVFFVTSADSGAFVIDAIATRGAAHSPVWQRLFWAALLGVTAAVLLVAGGLKALQAMTLIAALPVALIMLALCYGLWRGLTADHAHYSQDMAPATNFWTGQHWRHRLSHILRQTTAAEARQFVAETVLPALRKVADELRAGGVDAHVQRDDDDTVRLTVPTPDQRDFVYGARVSRKSAPAFLLREAAEPEPQRAHVYEIVTFFEDGRLGYDIEYLRGDEVIADVLRQYERYVSLAGDRRTHLLNRAPGHAGTDGPA